MKLNKSLGGRIAHLEAGSSQNFTQIEVIEMKRLTSTLLSTFAEFLHSWIFELSIHTIKKMQHTYWNDLSDHNVHSFNDAMGRKHEL